MTYSKFAAIAAIALLLPSCAVPGDSVSDFGRAAPLGYPAIDQSGTMPMMEDPEAEQEDWTDTVWAYDQADAEQLCRDKADQASDKDARVVFQHAQVASKRKNQAGKQLYTCWFTSYIESYGRDDNQP